MIKQPITLTIRILSGKYDSVGSSLLAIKYLVSAPIEPQGNQKIISHTKLGLLHGDNLNYRSN